MQHQSIEKPKGQPLMHSNIYHEDNVNDEISTITKTIAVLSYITLLGWLAAIFLHGSHKSTFASFHLRQSLGLIITGALLALIPLIGWLLNIAVCFVWLYCLYHAVQGHKKNAPWLGDFYQEHLDFIK